jgi:hypothetical protein
MSYSIMYQENTELVLHLFDNIEELKNILKKLPHKKVIPQREGMPKTYYIMCLDHNDKIKE